MRNAPSNNDNVIDSLDIIARIEELKGERDAYSGGDDGSPDPFEENEPARRVAWADANEDDATELAALVALAEEAEGYAADWKYGETLIRDSYFTDYAMGLLQDIGDLPKDIPHYIVIDEEATARNIQQDYTSVEFDGVTYWIR